MRPGPEMIPVLIDAARALKGSQRRVFMARIVQAMFHLRFCRMTVHPPIGKQKYYPALSLTVIHAHQDGRPRGGSRSGGNS